MAAAAIFAQAGRTAKGKRGRSGVDSVLGKPPAMLSPCDTLDTVGSHGCASPGLHLPRIYRCNKLRGFPCASHSVAHRRRRKSMGTIRITTLEFLVFSAQRFEIAKPTPVHTGCCLPLLCAAPSALEVIAAANPGLTAGAFDCRAFGPEIGAESTVGHPLTAGAIDCRAFGARLRTGPRVGCQSGLQSREARRAGSE